MGEAPPPPPRPGLVPVNKGLRDGGYEPSRFAWDFVTSKYESRVLFDTKESPLWYAPGGFHWPMNDMTMTPPSSEKANLNSCVTPIPVYSTIFL